MTFDTPNGSTGARQPTAGRLMRWFNRFADKRIRKRGTFFGGMDALVLTTVGRKTGTERRTPVGWFPDESDGWLIVASAAGAPKNPAWYHNIAANPDKVRIDLAGRTHDVTAEQLHGEQRDRAWQRITAAAPRFADYQRATDRQLPIIRLTPRH